MSRFEVLRSPFSCYLETVNCWLIEEDPWWKHNYGWVSLEEHLRDGSAEACAVKSSLVVGHVDLVTLRTVYLDSARTYFVVHTHRQHLLFVAKRARAVAEMARQVAVVEQCHA